MSSVAPTPTDTPTLDATEVVVVGGRRFSFNVRESGIYVAFLAIVVLFSVLTDGALLEPQNISNIIVQNSYILILAIGMILVIIGGHIDLSAGSVVAVCGAVSAVLMVNHDVPWPVALLVTIVVGAFIGAWQGYWVAYFGIPAFIVTLAGMLVFRGAAQIALGNQQISFFPKEFRAIGSGFLPAFGTTGYEPLTLIIGIVASLAIVGNGVRQRMVRRKYNLEDEPVWWFAAKLVFLIALVMIVAFLLASYNGTPIVLIILGALVVGYTIVMQRSVFGRHIYAIGGNLNAAALSGIKTKRVTFLLFVNMGVIAAVAGIVFTAGLNLASPSAGTGFELDAISAVFIGGAAVTGGIGTVPGAIIGGLIIGVLNNGMSILGVDSDYQLLIKGLVLLAAVAFDVYNKRRSTGR